MTSHNDSNHKHLLSSANVYEPRYNSLFSSCPDGMFCLDLQGRFVDVNPALVTLTKISREDLLQIKLIDLVAPNNIADVALAIETIKDGTTNQLNICLPQTKNQNLTVQLTTMPIFVSGHIIGIHGFMRDLSIHGFYDPLTNLPCRELLLEQLSCMLKNTRLSYETIAVLYIDLDRFRIINEAWGHTFGNQLIRSIATRLQSSLSPKDYLARTVGDEFAILLHRARHNQVEHFAENLQKLISEPFKINGQKVSITACIGISVATRLLNDANTLLSYAEIAMTYAKRQSHNDVYFFTQELGASAMRRVELESEFSQALTESQFVVYYQPQVDLDLNRTVGVEALVRWNHPQRGMISPMDFIPLAEESGFIIPLGEWILRTACEQFQAWLEMGSSLSRLSVNISVAQFEQDHFCEQVLAVLEGVGLDPGYLELEITESQMLNMEGTINKIHALRARGIKIAIDDFGTGYSPLSHLRHIGVDTLKIDRGFIKEICENARDLMIVKTIINLAQIMKLNLIAEGVETRNQLVLLGDNRLREVQGYYFSPPLPHQEIEKLIFAN